MRHVTLQVHARAGFSARGLRSSGNSHFVLQSSSYQTAWEGRLATARSSVFPTCPACMPSQTHAKPSQPFTSCGSARAYATPCSSHGPLQPAAQHCAPRVLVLGGGVIGLTSALRLARELPGAQITVVAHAYGNTLTSAGAAGMWGPYKLADTPDELVYRWGSSTYEHLLELAYSAAAPEAGVMLCGCHWLQDQPEAPPSWAPILDGFRQLTPRELNLINTGSVSGAGHAIPRSSSCGSCGRAAEAARAALPPYVSGWYGKAIVCEGKSYLTWLAQELTAAGGTLLVSPAPLTSLQQLLDPAEQHTWAVHSAPPPAPDGAAGTVGPARCIVPDVVVNCTGLGARKLLGDDAVCPVRGQIMRVRAPWIRDGYTSDRAYVLPNRDTVVLGGTAQVGNWDQAVSEDDKQRIWQNCLQLMPSLAYAEVVQDWVGLRPSRSSVRLELDATPLVMAPSAAGVAGMSGAVPVVHSYGHGGAGLTLAWGCAGDVVQLVRSALQTRV